MAIPVVPQAVPLADPVGAAVPFRAPAAPVAKHRLDPRLYQIAALACLLAYGTLRLGFAGGPGRTALLLASVLAAQYLCTRLWKLPRFDPKSALISGLSLCLLLRTNSPVWAALVAAITIASKFAIRVDGRHLFNPTNFGIVAALVLGGDVWVSPGQWGNAAFFGFLMVCVGGLVVHRAARSDVTIAFLLAYAAVQFARSLWLGQPLNVPLHRLQNGALLLFAFFMISDPKTTPDSRAGRIVFATLVALGAGFVHFVLYRNNGLLWSLALFSVAVPWLNRWLPGPRYAWGGARSAAAPGKETAMKRWAVAGSAALLWLATAVPSWGFCGFYVARADTKLYNKASRVVLVRDGDRTVITMANDFKGDPKEFAVVVPVPTFIRREQIHVNDAALLDHLDAYSAPRLVEYYDPDPCQRLEMDGAVGQAFLRASPAAPAAALRERSLGVTVEARYTVGEYDIVILSAEQSDGLETWLRQNGYRPPAGASRVLGSYIKQGMRFFVARVNLEKQSALGFTYLRPLSIAYESPKFMLPIRLGMVNADGAQELFVWALTRHGRVESTNYRTVRLPTGMDLPLFVKEEFADFYRAMFAHQVEKESMRAVFLEYAWDMGWCDPCAAEPLSNDELRQLGVFWLEPTVPTGAVPFRGRVPANVFVTRLHLRYDRDHFPEDLTFQVTGDRETFQGRYVMRHPWKGEADCDGAQGYRRELRKRQQHEAEELAGLTGWDLGKILSKVDLASVDPETDPWWKTLWREK
jgi:Na+-translocating ferredoxin:NAD+ oxidoreductase RnfD subunit